MSLNDGIKSISWVLFGILFLCAIMSTGVYIRDYLDEDRRQQEIDSLLKVSEDNIGFDTLDIKVKVTSYQPTIEQCDSTPFVTANGSHIKDYSYGLWCAVSKDLFYDKINFNDTIYLLLDSSVRVLIVKDIVQGSKHVDILEPVGMRFKDMPQGFGKIIRIIPK